VSSQTNGKRASGWRHEQKSSLPRLASDTLFHSFTDAREKAQGENVTEAGSHVVLGPWSAQAKAEILAVLRAGSGVTLGAQHFRGRLVQLAKRFPDFAAFRALCLQDLRETWHEDQAARVRTVHNRVQTWKRLFNYFARPRGLESKVRIGALNYAGGYECELVPRQPPDLWERFIDVGTQVGVPMTLLMALHEKYKGKPVKTIRARARRTLANRVG
jgi:hypothetical protein